MRSTGIASASFDSVAANACAEKRGAIGGEAYLQIKDETKKMTESLREDITKVSPTDYTVAKKFLQSLAYEAGLPPG